MRRGADRVRKIADAEWMAYEEAETRELERLRLERRAAAVSLGYHRPAAHDPFPPLVCPECGAIVSDSQAQQHTDWHGSLTPLQR